METDQASLSQPPVHRGRDHAENPYVGPKPLQSCNRLYGRDCELRDLCDLLIAERLVLLYSPSGAGKSSLINAGLVTLLRKQEKFRVLPTLRVNLHSPEQRGDKENRYVRSVKECLLTGLTVEQREAMASNTLPSLSDFLGQRPHCELDGPADSKFEVLIFDQFEEICTLDPTDREKKEQFFSELRETLRNRNRWALFVIREDYLAEVDSFSHLLPTALNTRFRLNLLTIAQAREAIAGPAAAQGSILPPEQVDELAAELATVTLHCGEELKQTVGEYVEPVQLQVVCRRLWQQHLDGKWMLSDSKARDTVDAALEAYYADAVAASAGYGGSSEGQLRTWIETHLVVKPAMRNQVMRTPDETLGLPDECVQALVNEHLLRFDRRGGREWIEITHDRMIAPILVSNERWRSAHLQPFQRQAQLWAAGERGTNMLLSRQRYDEAVGWVRTAQHKLSEDERDYLRESEKEIERFTVLARNHQAIRRERWLIVFACCAFLCAAVYFRFQEKISYIDKLNGEALALPQGQYEMTLHNAISAYDNWARLPRWPALGVDAGIPLRPSVSDRLYRSINAALLAGLVAVPPAQTRLAGPLGHSASVRQLAFHPQRKLLASASADGAVLLWDLDNPILPVRRFAQKGQAYTVAFNAAGDRLAIGGASGVVEVWRIGAPGAPALTFAYPAQVGAVAFEGQSILATALWNGEVRVQDLDRPQDPAAVLRPAGEGGAIASMVFMPGGKLAFGDASGIVRIWPWRTPGAPAIAPQKTMQLDFFSSAAASGATTRQAAIQGLSYDARSDRLAASGWTREQADGPRLSHIAIWEHAATTPVRAPDQRLSGVDGGAHALAFSPDGSMLAYTGGDSRSLGIADLLPPQARTKRAIPGPLRFQEQLFSVAFAPYPSQQGRVIAVGGGSAISLVDLDAAGPLPTRGLPLTASFGSRPAQAYHAAMSADGGTVVMGAGSMLSVHHGTGKPLSAYQSHPPIPGGVNTLTALALSADGRMVALAGSADEPVRLLDRNGALLHALPRGLCPPGRLQGEKAYSLAFNPAGGAQQLAIASGSALCVLSLGAAAPTLDGRTDHGAVIRALAYSADGKHLAALEGDSTIRLHRGGWGRLTFQAPAMKLTTLAFTSDPRYLAIGTADPDIFILDLANGSTNRLTPLHESDIASLHFAVRNGAEMMVSADIEGRILLWEKYKTSDKRFEYRRLGRALTQKGMPAPVALSGQGDLLLSGGATPRMFDLRMESLLALACETVQERSKYKVCKSGRP